MQGRDDRWLKPDLTDSWWEQQDWEMGLPLMLSAQDSLVIADILRM